MGPAYEFSYLLFAPHVTGAAALYKMSNLNASVNDVRTFLKDSGSNNTTVCDGSGRGYFTDDPDPDREPLLYLIDAIKLLSDKFSHDNTIVPQ